LRTEKLAPDGNLDDPLVSIILAVHNGARWLDYALKSLIAQTWHNLDIVVVDDGSEDGTPEVLRGFTERDPRVTVLSHKTSRGLFSSRNTGLDSARGQFVTTHDADDWSHSEKIARQVRQLMDNPSLAANYSQWVRCSSEIYFQMREAAGRYVHVNSNSLMARKEVFTRLGGWDPVRFSADSEFVARVRQVYGRTSVGVVEEGPLSFGLERPDSLTRSAESHGKSAYAGVRREYREHFEAWHSRNRKSAGTWIVRETHGGRRFPAPLTIHSKQEESLVTRVQVVVLGDFTKQRSKRKIKELLSGNLETSSSVVLVHLPSFSAPLKPVDRSLRDQENLSESRFAACGDEVHAEVAIFVDWGRSYGGNFSLPKICVTSQAMVLVKRHLKALRNHPLPSQWELPPVAWAPRKENQKEIARFLQTSNTTDP
jgi:hypothetical protein